MGDLPQRTLAQQVGHRVVDAVCVAEGSRTVMIRFLSSTRARISWASAGIRASGFSHMMGLPAAASVRKSVESLAVGGTNDETVQIVPRRQTVQSGFEVGAVLRRATPAPILVVIPDRADTRRALAGGDLIGKSLEMDMRRRCEAKGFRHVGDPGLSESEVDYSRTEPAHRNAIAVLRLSISAG